MFTGEELRIIAGSLNVAMLMFENIIKDGKDTIYQKEKSIEQLEKIYDLQNKINKLNSED